MPELPEVETTIRSLKAMVLNRTVVGCWADAKKIIKIPNNFEQFEKQIKNKKINNIKRRGKNILFFLSGKKILLIHQKLTGHLLLGKWEYNNGVWQSLLRGPLKRDPRNKFLHLIFFLDSGKMIALSDLRKFAKVELWDGDKIEDVGSLNELGPEPLDKSFTFLKFKEVLSKKGKIKQILMDQNIIAGIGNIYSDEILWEARINPLKDVSGLKGAELARIYKSIPKILNKAIMLKGDSMSDYRLVTGELGGYQKIQRVYQREGKSCFRKDGGIIKRIKIGGRSAHFCPICQK